MRFWGDYANFFYELGILNRIAMVYPKICEIQFICF